MPETELKIPVDSHGPVIAILGALGAVDEGVSQQVDMYYDSTHFPIASRDMALRIRQINGTYELTYKGPKLDGEAKIRDEVNLGCASDPAPILASLGFKASAGVDKTRHTFRLPDAEICLDEIAGVGKFVEIEAVGATIERLHEIARQLGLEPTQHTSTPYLEMAIVKGVNTIPGHK